MAFLKPHSRFSLHVGHEFASRASVHQLPHHAIEASRNVGGLVGLQRFKALGNALINGHGFYWH
jgi:hypothetical protein